MGKDMSVRKGITKIATEFDGSVITHDYPFADVDETYVWNVDKTPAQIVQTGLGKTKTTIFTWNPNGTLASKATVIT